MKRFVRVIFFFFVLLEFCIYMNLWGLISGFVFYVAIEIGGNGKKIS